MHDAHMTTKHHDSTTDPEPTPAPTPEPQPDPEPEQNEAADAEMARRESA